MLLMYPVALTHKMKVIELHSFIPQVFPLTSGMVVWYIMLEDLVHKWVKF